MATQFNSSPFVADNKNTSMPLSATSTQNDFFIHTMQSDLTSLKSNGDIEKTVFKPNKTTPTQQPKPFDQNDLTSIKISPFPMQEKDAERENINEISASNDANNNKQSTSVKIIIAFIAVLIVSIIGLGIYYALIVKNSKQAVVVTTPAPVESVEPIKQTITEAPVVEAPLQQKYSNNNPNYLSLDLNTLNADGIKAKLISTEDELKSTEMKSPYEFIVVDSNNNPVAFPIFALATKLNLSPTLLSSLGPNFSLYIYNDNSNMRLAISATIKNKDILTKELIKQEKTFITDGSFLFLNNAPEIKNGIFSTGSYGKYTIKFLNLNTAKDLSIDYTTTDSQLVVGTSKNAEHAVLDKLDKEPIAKKADLSNNTNSSNIINSNAASTVVTAPINTDSSTNQNQILQK